MNGYGSEMDASPPFFWEAVGHKHGLMLHRKIMWRDRYSATGCSPALQAVDSKQAENLLVQQSFRQVQVYTFWTDGQWKVNRNRRLPSHGMHGSTPALSSFASRLVRMAAAAAACSKP